MFQWIMLDDNVRSPQNMGSKFIMEPSEENWSYHAKRVQSIKTLTVITNKYERSFRTRASQKKRHIYAVLKYDYADRFIEQV